MKNFVVLLIYLAFSHGSFAQKCKWTINKKDAFTGEQTNALVHTNSGVTWTSMKRGEKLLVEMTFFHAGEVHTPMLVSDTVLMKLADGTILHLAPSVEVPPFGENKSFSSTTSPGRNQTAITRTVTVTSYSPLFQVDRTVYEQLANSGLVAIRLNFMGKPEDLDFSKKPLSKSVEVIMNNSKCILGLQ